MSKLCIHYIGHSSAFDTVPFTSPVFSSIWYQSVRHMLVMRQNK